MLQALAETVQDNVSVCNHGKAQHLVVRILQGRLPGVQIDKEAPLAAGPALNMFLQIPEIQKLTLTDLQEVLKKAREWLAENPNVEKEAFLKGLEEFWAFKE
jgi:hypothetical protein